MKCKYKEMCGYDICTEEDCPKYKPAQETVADRIRSMNDRELGRFLCKFQSDCDECCAKEFCSPGNSGMDEWLRLPAEGEDLE